MKFSIHHKTRNHSFKLVAAILGVIVVLVIAVSILVQQWYTSNLRPVGREATVSEQFSVAEGSSSDAIAASLEERGLIRDATAFKWYVRRGGHALQAGEYQLNNALSVQDIVALMSEGRVSTRLITIAPGIRLDQVRESLIEQGFAAAEVDAALNRTYDAPILDYKPEGASLEGFLYPESFQATSATTAQEIIERSLNQFYLELDGDILAGLKKKGLTPYEGIILASVVAKESGNEDDSPLIASVFLNRLRLDMPLGADATAVYASRIAGVPPSVEIESPYNTRIVKGLPPGPISNFMISELRAVAHAPESEHLYFVSGDDGVTYFSKTLEEHEANTEMHCSVNCILPQ